MVFQRGEGNRLLIFEALAGSPLPGGALCFLMNNYTDVNVSLDRCIFICCNRIIRGATRQGRANDIVAKGFNGDFAVVSQFDLSLAQADLFGPERSEAPAAMHRECSRCQSRFPRFCQNQLANRSLLSGSPAQALRNRETRDLCSRGVLGDDSASKFRFKVFPAPRAPESSHSPREIPRCNNYSLIDQSISHARCTRARFVDSIGRSAANSKGERERRGAAGEEEERRSRSGK